MFLTDIKNGLPTVVGVKQSQKAIARSQAKGVLIAEDADIHVTGPVQELCKARQVPVEMVPTMQELGRACGIHVGAAVAAVLKNR